MALGGGIIKNIKNNRTNKCKIFQKAKEHLKNWSYYLISVFHLSYNYNIYKSKNNKHGFLQLAPWSCA